MRRAWGNNTDRILALLRDAGPLTGSQIAQQLGCSLESISSALFQLRQNRIGPRSAPKRVYISSWVYGLPGQKNHLRPVYAIGAFADKAKPPLKTKRQSNIEQWQRLRALAAS